MANRKDDKGATRSTSSTRGGGARRGAPGDEPRTSSRSAAGGAREEHTGPSTQPVSEGLEGAIFDDTGERAERRARGARSSSSGDTGAPQPRTRGKGRRTR